MDQQPGLPLVGRIKVGEKRKTADGSKEYPASLDYFRPDGKYIDKFTEAFGEKPVRIPVVFVSDNYKDSCSQYFAAWEKGKCYGEGDGETFKVWDASAGQKDSKGNPTGAYVENLPKTDPRVKAIKTWAEYMKLRVVIPAIKDVLGVWEFTTKASKSTIPNIISTFDFIQSRAGTIIGFPFDLVVTKAQGYNPGQPKNYPVVSLIPNRGEENIVAIKNYLSGGGRIEDIAAISMNETKLLALSRSTEAIPAVVIEEGEK